MESYTYINVEKDCISITIDFSCIETMSIGNCITAFCEGDYSDAVYYCQAFLNNYLRQNAPEIFDSLKVIHSVSGAEMCTAYIEGINDRNKALAEKLVQIIEDLFSNEEKVFTFLEQNADDIDWNLGGNVTNYRIEAVSQFWICDYVVYGLYLGEPEKFLVSPNEDSPIGPRKTGDNSGYIIVLNYNNQGVENPILFQITSRNADQIHVHGGIPGTNYIDSYMDANSAIQLLLSY